MKRAGGWALGLLIVGTLAGGGWFAFDRIYNRKTVAVICLWGDKSDGPTAEATRRGAAFALEEAGERAGRFRVILRNIVRSPSSEIFGVVYLGTTAAIQVRGLPTTDHYSIATFDTRALGPAADLCITPECGRQGRSAAVWAKKEKADRVFLLRDKPHLRSEVIADVFERSARSLELEVEGVLDTSVELPTLIDRVLASRADLVFYSGEEAPYGTATKIFTALRDKGYAGTLVTGEADPEVSYLATRPRLVEGMYLVSPFAPAPPDLVSRMGNPVPGPHVTAGYYAMKAALDVIDRANSVEPAELRRAAAGLETRPCALYVARNGRFEFVELLK